MSESRQFIHAGAARRPLCVGADLGGTSLKVGVVDSEGGVLSCLNVPAHVEQGPAAGAERIAAAIEEAVARAGLSMQDIEAIGLGSPGGIDAVAGTLLFPANLPLWGGFPLRSTVAERCRLPVKLFNDAAAAAYGEFWVGTAEAFASMVLLTLGTGVGGGAILGGRLIDGDHGAGTELGHIIIDYNDSARLCSCGQRGHLEAYASASAVVRRTEEALAAGPKSSLADRLAAGETLTARLIAGEAERNDAVSLTIMLDTARFLGIGVVTMLHALDPSIVVLGGAMTFGGPTSQLGQRFLQRIRQEVRERALPPVAATPIEFASLGAEAGFIGAAGLARGVNAEC
jgi:glucokinase